MEALPENSVDVFFQEGIDSANAIMRSTEKEAVKLHRLFKQNEDGAALLNEWKEILIMAPTLNRNSTQFEAGIAEGYKQFIRNIIIQVERFEQQNSGEANE